MGFGEWVAGQTVLTAKFEVDKLTTRPTYQEYGIVRPYENKVMFTDHDGFQKLRIFDVLYTLPELRPPSYRIENHTGSTKHRFSTSGATEMT